MDTVIPEAIAKWNELAKNLCEGNLKFSEIFWYMENFAKKWENEFRSLMEYQHLSSDIINLRLRQININKKLNGALKVSKILLDLKEKLGLTGEFQNLHKIYDSVSFK